MRKVSSNHVALVSTIIDYEDSTQIPRPAYYMRPIPSEVPTITDLGTE